MSGAIPLSSPNHFRPLCQYGKELRGGQIPPHRSHMDKHFSAAHSPSKSNQIAVAIITPLNSRHLLIRSSLEADAVWRSPVDSDFFLFPLSVPDGFLQCGSRSLAGRAKKKGNSVRQTSALPHFFFHRCPIISATSAADWSGQHQFRAEWRRSDPKSLGNLRWIQLKIPISRQS